MKQTEYQQNIELIRAGKTRSLFVSVCRALFFCSLVLALFAVAELYAPGPKNTGGQNHVVIIKPGMSVSEIGRLLERTGAIRSALTFRLGALLWGSDKNMQAGEYALPSRTSLHAVIEWLSTGEVIFHPLTIPEGLTSFTVARLLSESDLLSGPPLPPPPEGSILPDTYLLARGIERADLLTRMQAARDEVLERLWRTRQDGLPVATPEEAVILASIVQKETALREEMPRVAAVFINRMRRRMRLESDPTVVYGLTRGKPLGRGLTRSELDTSTPYNTYRMRGLTPTPICNPGREAISAVLNPASTTDLFFVADGAGGHVFAQTYEQHRKNVASWRRIEARRKAATAKQ